MQTLKNLFAALDSFGATKNEKKDGLKISNSKQELVNLREIHENNLYEIVPAQEQVSKKFLHLLETLTGWKFYEEKWCFSNLIIKRFSKKVIKPNNREFNKLLQENPLSWAMTSGSAIECTLESPDNLLERK